MPAETNQTYNNINELLEQLVNNETKEDSLIKSIELANEILIILGARKNKLIYGENALDKAFSNSKFRNQKMETWFVRHPYLKGARTAISLFKETEEVYESNFFWLNESATKARISASVMLSPNWEDSELTMLPNYKVGIDFFLTGNSNSLLVVISNKGNLRVLELSEKLSNTQIEILNNIKGCLLFDGIDPKTGTIPQYEPQKTIHRKLWDALELKEVNKKFYIGIADHFEQLCQHLERKTNLLDSDEITKKNLQNFSSRLIGRILFIWFLRKKNIVDESQGFFSTDDLSSTEFYNRKIKRLFFETLNTPIEDRESEDKKTPYLNGGLFDIHKDDLFSHEFTLPLGWFDSLFKHLNEFNFTTDESTPEYEQIAIDPEMLGRVFENLLASIVDETASIANERKNKGAFYTPREIVSYMCKETLCQYLKNVVDNNQYNSGIERLIFLNDSDFYNLKSTGIMDLWGVQTKNIQEIIVNALNNLKILDPACGSGAFPMSISNLISSTYERLSANYDKDLKKHTLARGGAPFEKYDSKMSILKNNIYGSDIEPMAIEITRLRFWLSLLMEEQNSIEPLPNLDFNFVCADSLIRLENEKQLSIDFDGTNEKFERDFDKLRKMFFDMHQKKDKLKLTDDFQNLYSNFYCTDNTKQRILQLKSWNPFDVSKPASFFDEKVMFGINDKFDIIIGNPPYKGSGSRGLSSLESDKKTLYKKNYPNSAEYKINLYALFMEHAISKLNKYGICSYIVPDSYLVGRYFSKIRAYIVRKTSILKLLLLDSKVFESATVGFSSIFFLKNGKADNNKVSLINPSTKSLGDATEAFVIDQSFFEKQAYNRFFMFFDDFDYNLFNIINNNKETIGKYATGRTGIRSKIGQKNIISTIKESPSHMKGIISGGQITKFNINYEGHYLNVDPNILNAGGFDKEIIEKPKILVRQTGDSLIAAIDKNKYYHLNNVHSLALKNKNGKMSLELLCALLNSSLINYYYEITSMEKGRPMAQVDIETLEFIPIPQITVEDHNRIRDLVNQLEKAEVIDNFKSIIDEIDHIVFDIYNIESDNRIEILRRMKK